MLDQYLFVVADADAGDGVEEQRAEFGHGPAERLLRDREKEPTESDVGQFVERSVIREGGHADDHGAEMPNAQTPNDRLAAVRQCSQEGEEHRRVAQPEDEREQR